MKRFSCRPIDSCVKEFVCVCARAGECLSPPHSPDSSSLPEFKENKEPSPKIKRRRSVKISSVTLEPAQWQNDALQILTCANDYRSMNEFLMKKVLLQVSTGLQTVPRMKATLTSMYKNTKLT